MRAVSQLDSTVQVWSINSEGDIERDVAGTPENFALGSYKHKDRMGRERPRVASVLLRSATQLELT